MYQDSISKNTKLYGQSKNENDSIIRSHICIIVDLIIKHITRFSISEGNNAFVLLQTIRLSETQGFIVYIKPSIWKKTDFIIANFETNCLSKWMNTIWKVEKVIEPI